MINYGYSPTFPSPRYFQLPQSSPISNQLIPQPTTIYAVQPPLPNPIYQVPTTAQNQQQITTQQIQQTTNTTSNGTSSNNPFPTEVKSIDPLNDSDKKIPNKTFEVLQTLKPQSPFLVPIPTTYVSLDANLNPTNRMPLRASSDAIHPHVVEKLNRTPDKTSSYGTRSDALSLVSEKQGLLVNEIKIHKGPPIVRWLFLLAGIALIVVGVLTTLWCRPSDQFYYCRIWGGIALIVFCIIGYVHRQDYITKWKNLSFVIIGLVTSVMTFACLYYVMKIFCHRIIEIFQFNSWDDYLDEAAWRMQYLDNYPKINLTTTGQRFPGDNEAACIAMDGVSVILSSSSFIIVLSVTLVVDKFYSSLHVITLMVKPFNIPTFFNPYGQVIVGEVQIFFGFLLHCVVYGNQNITWQNVLAPVFSGVVPIIAGITSALTLKSCGINSKIWNFLSIILEIVAMVIDCIAIILLTTGLIENVNAFNSGTMTQTTYSRNFMIFSVFAFSSADLICLISFCYASAIIIKLLTCICCPERMHTARSEGDKGAPPLERSYDNDDQMMDGRYREVDKLLLKL